MKMELSAPNPNGLGTLITGKTGPTYSAPLYAAGRYTGPMSASRQAMPAVNPPLDVTRAVMAGEQLSNMIGGGRKKAGKTKKDTKKRHYSRMGVGKSKTEKRRKQSSNTPKR